MVRAFFLIGGLMALTATVSDRALAQGAGGNPFAPVIMVNDLGITGFEIDQRMRFLQLLRAPGDLRAEAEKALIDDRLRTTAAKRDGVTVTDEAVAQGMTEFAGRANMNSEQFVQAISQAGVEVQTFRDFVEAGLLWREVVRARFAPGVRISEADIDRALALENERGKGTRVLMSEIILPAPPGQEEAAMAQAQQISQLQGEGAFGAAAREVSAAPSRANGGRLEWLPIDNLPPPLRPVILGLKPGQASAPVGLPGGVAVFMLRALDEAGPVQATPQQIDYASLTLSGPEAQSTQGRIRAAVDTCNDLYAVKGLPADLVTRQTLPLDQIPQDVALELARLDAGEIATVQRGDSTLFLMLCKRERLMTEGVTAPSRDEVRNQLQNARIAAIAENYLADLRADAVISRKD